MKIIAVMACRNEAAYLPTCLKHLIGNGIGFAVVDNDSTDDSMDIIHSAAFKPHLAGVSRVPYEGNFNLGRLLEEKRKLASQVRADWILNLCPDELPHSNRQGVTLRQEVEMADKAGFNVINFDEFVFLPLDGIWKPDQPGWPALRHYYFFEPWRYRQMRLWKAGSGLSGAQAGGHLVEGEKRFAPESLALRHYIFTDQAHAFEKFTTRTFAQSDIDRGWHRNRINIPRARYQFPDVAQLETLDDPASFALSRARPWTKHYWERDFPKKSALQARVPVSGPALGRGIQNLPQRSAVRSGLAQIRRRLIPDGTPLQQRYHLLRKKVVDWYRGPQDAWPVTQSAAKTGGERLSVVVLSLNAQPEVLHAVRSLYEQAPRPEIIVVNSGQPGVEALFAQEPLKVTVLESSNRLMPGAARNLGIAAAHGDFVAFLAADCIALPGWVQYRLSRHLSGARMVSTPVVNDRPRNPFSTAAHILLFAGRLPGTPAKRRQHYGISYDLSLLREHGLFDPHLRTGEDTELHARIGSSVRPVYEPRARTAHRNPRTPRALLRDQFLRGRRRALASREIGLTISRQGMGLFGIRRARTLLRIALKATPGSQWHWLLLALPWLFLGGYCYVLGVRSAQTIPFSQGGEAAKVNRPPRLLALLQYRNDETYLPGYLENLERKVDGILMLDDGSDSPIPLVAQEHEKVLEIIRIATRFPHEWDERRNQRILIDAAKRHGCDWMIAVDADERLENDFRARAECYFEQAEANGNVAYSLKLRELWDAGDQYRVDGIWGRKRRPRLFRPLLNHRQGETQLHSNWAPLNGEEKRRGHPNADLIIYHLAMLTEAQRKARQAKYQELDPNNESQAIGYEYLTDVAGIELEKIASERDYRNGTGGANTDGVNTSPTANITAMARTGR